MSTATHETIQRLVPISEDGYTLRLSSYEAETLAAVCGRIGGANNRRHVFSDDPNSILEQLQEAGVHWDYRGPVSDLMDGRIRFDDE
jgi:hypothetical protein